MALWSHQRGTDVSIAEAHLHRERVSDCKVSETQTTSPLLHHSFTGEVIIQKLSDLENTLYPGI